MKTRRRNARPRLKPAFKKDGTVTAGNAPGVNDGASAVVVMAGERAQALGLTPMARIVGQATSGLAPKLVLMTPVEAVRKVAAKVGWNSRTSISSRSTRRSRCSRSPSHASSASIPRRVNVHGGAVALGHAIGASGARVLTTLLYALKRRDAEARHRVALPRRRQRRRAGDRATVVGLSRLAAWHARLGRTQPAPGPSSQRTCADGGSA